MGFLTVTEVRLVELREKLRPSVVAVIEERTKKGRVFKDSKGLASKLYSFKHDPGTPRERKKTDAGANVEPCNSNLDEFLSGLATDSETESLPDLQEQVTPVFFGNLVSSNICLLGFFFYASFTLKEVENDTKKRMFDLPDRYPNT